MNDAESTGNNRRIVKNTLMLYTRQILILLVSLYTIRVVLDVLGVVDYGIYYVLIGVVTLLSFLSGTMASASQRFFSFALGEKNQEKLNSIFSVNLLIYIAIVVIAVVLLETVGLWYVKNRLEIPPERLDAVIFLFHYSVITFIVTILSSPFMAVIIAHEDMQYYAYISIVEALLRLGTAILMMEIEWDKLKLYAVLLLAVAIVTTATYVLVGLTKYTECQFRRFYWDKILFKKIVNFTGWTLFGQFTTVSRDQAITILLNQMFNPVTVAARAVATNISSKITMFSANFNVGLYPPIIKAYASDDRENMYKLITNGSKITFFLMWIFSLPLFLEMEMILNIWLINPPAEAVLFTRLAIIESLILSVSLPIATAARAPGRMRTYELLLGLLQLLLFGIAWIVLKMGYSAYSIYVVAIGINLIMFIVRLAIVGRLTGLPIQMYLKRAIFPLLTIVVLSGIGPLVLKWGLPSNFFNSLITIASSFLISGISIYFIGLNKEYRGKLKTVIVERLKR